ncbi:hypothetical protein [Neglectibacter sp. 59]|uniref:hypothetical protein n=2 Tax=unclassified Neglectibacter TaxID=2632164 RepID=UPI00192A223E|nr:MULTISPECIES: hypothetical protein [unclassified Neglectibacter]
MSYMTSAQQAKCHAIIHTASAAAGAVGGGLAQIPASDSIVITPIQLAMVLSLGKVFDLELSDSAGMASLASASGAAVGRGISQVLVGWIPGIGNIINAGTAASLTEAIGWLLANDFAKACCSR